MEKKVASDLNLHKDESAAEFTGSMYQRVTIDSTVFDHLMLL